LINGFFFRQAKQEISQLQRHLAEQQKLNNQMQLRVEELSYRLSNNSSSLMSPFNPVFTQSPISVKPPNGHGGFSGAMIFPEEKLKKKGRKMLMSSQADDAIEQNSNGCG